MREYSVEEGSRRLCNDAGLSVKEGKTRREKPKKFHQLIASELNSNLNLQIPIHVRATMFSTL